MILAKMSEMLCFGGWKSDCELSLPEQLEEEDLPSALSLGLSPPVPCGHPLDQAGPPPLRVPLGVTSAGTLRENSGKRLPSRTEGHPPASVWAAGFSQTQ